MNLKHLNCNALEAIFFCKKSPQIKSIIFNKNVKKIFFNTIMQNKNSTDLTGCMLISQPVRSCGSLYLSKPNLTSISSFKLALCNRFSVESSRVLNVN